MRWQKVEYDFNYHRQDFPSNVPVLVISEGKSLLPVSKALKTFTTPLNVELVLNHFHREYGF